MLVAVVSDTHRVDSYINLALQKIKDADILIHLGDNVEDVRRFEEGFKGEVFAVSGNCDYSDLYPEERIVKIGDKRLFLTHGHRYGVKSGLNSLFYKAKELEVDAALYGHTHQEIILKEDGILIMNPGSVSLPRGEGRFVGFLEIEEGKEIKAYLKEL
ncbi:MAG: metallophosphoesterase [Clostridium sp.]|uniref:metallophosphoesterase n=1 Tax=Clostridium TaxID=1485 RepID=UPI0018843575|nr:MULTISPECIES: metallophosphoesterase [Clostridium]MCR6514871.1 metallophosphoesterase [Clostridium sp. LY3-2]